MPKEAKNKEKKQKHFLKDVKAELKKVIWPTSKQLFNNTLAVIVIVLIVGAIVFVLDVCFKEIYSLGIEKVNQIVETKHVDDSTNEETDSHDHESEVENSQEELNAEETTVQEESSENTENAQEEQEGSNE